jgi:hypothetical protein
VDEWCRPIGQAADAGRVGDGPSRGSASRHLRNLTSAAEQQKRVGQPARFTISRVDVDVAPIRIVRRAMAVHDGVILMSFGTSRVEMGRRYGCGSEERNRCQHHKVVLMP